MFTFLIITNAAVVYSFFQMKQNPYSIPNFENKTVALSISLTRPRKQTLII